MLERITEAFDSSSRTLLLRAERQRVLAGNIANADTPGYKAVDFSFADAMRAANSGPVAASASRTHARHLAAANGLASAVSLLYRYPGQPAIDNNTVDLDLERAQFADNAIRYEATLRFISGQMRSFTQAISGPNQNA